MSLTTRLLLLTLVITAPPALARPIESHENLEGVQSRPDIVGDVDGRNPAPHKALQDTVWIADWSFDGAGACNDTGWETVDNRVRYTGEIYWRVEPGYGGVGAIVENAAILGNHDPCCVDPYGYGNNWYQAMRIEYSGSATLSFDYLLDSEPGWDFMGVELDSACSSFDQVDLGASLFITARTIRDYESFHTYSGFDTLGTVDSMTLPDFGTTENHCAYIRFFSDGGWSPCDGLQPTTLGAALVVDNIVINDDNGSRSENFDDGTLDIGTFVDLWDSASIGWARTFEHITDNDVCTENTTCAWLWTDDTTPTIANDPSMSFGPGNFVVRNWIHNSIVSPWVSLASTPAAKGTVLQFRRFGGNFWAMSRIAEVWGVRGRKQVASSVISSPGSSYCVDGWGQPGGVTLESFSWETVTRDLTPRFDPEAEEVQIRYRVRDWQYNNLNGGNVSPPSPHIPGPGPYVDRFRIGRLVLSGPVFSGPFGLGDFRFEAQDGFPTELFPGTGTPATGEDYRPTTNRFGTVAFSRAATGGPVARIRGDSISIVVQDLRDAGGLATVEWYGAVVAGPHQGKAPAPWTVGPNGFFTVPADSGRWFDGSIVDGHFVVDLDDTYFRGGDVLHYFWLATDAGGGVSSFPRGLTSVPGSIEEAQLATGGMREVSFLPAINWDPGYMARIAADPHGDLDPTEDELANSSQATCILYVQSVNFERRSGDINRTSFMYTLDRLGYRGSYDVYDHNGCGVGCGDMNNHLGYRATIQQAQGYSLIVNDGGNGNANIPEGLEPKWIIDQATWYRNWLDQGSIGEAGSATLWVIAADLAQQLGTNPLVSTDMGVLLASTNQGLNANPDVAGQTSTTLSRGNGTSCVADFSGDDFSLNGGCPSNTDYDGLGANGSAVATHLFQDPGTGALGDAAIVMKSDPSRAWNTIAQSFAWFDIRDPHGQSPGSPQAAEQLLSTILGCTLPLGCLQGIDPTDVPDVGPNVDALPRRTALLGNRPNPFNPTTAIHFDLASDAYVSLRIYDVAGRLVRKLVDEKMAAGANRSAVWDGLDDAGHRVSTGVYFYSLSAGDFSATRKMVVMK